jgi:hypothetical protein
MATTSGNKIEIVKIESLVESKIESSIVEHVLT